MDWEKLKIYTSMKLELKGTGIKLPAGRALAEDMLFSNYFSKIGQFILSIPVDSSSNIGDWVERGTLSPAAVDALAAGAERVPAVYTDGFNAIAARYTLDLTDVSQNLIHHKQPEAIPGTLTPVESAAYTGILIIAPDELPYHGRHISTQLVPCLFPKIWDTEMNLIYEKNMMNPEAFRLNTMIRYTKRANIFMNTPSGLAPDLEKTIGNKPLRIIARGVFGESPTDPIIYREDALKIISSEENKRLLREGRAAIVLSDDVLIKSILASDI
jgi:hypothetical protein